MKVNGTLVILITILFIPAVCKAHPSHTDQLISGVVADTSNNASDSNTFNLDSITNGVPESLLISYWCQVTNTSDFSENSVSFYDVNGSELLKVIGCKTNSNLFISDKIVQIPVGAATFTVRASISHPAPDYFSSIAASVLGKAEPIAENSPPVATKDRGISVVTGQSVVFFPMSNDYDPDGDTISITRAWQLDTPNNITLNENGSVTFTAGAGYIGGDYFYYEITDGNGDYDTASVIVEVMNP